MVNQSPLLRTDRRLGPYQAVSKTMQAYGLDDTQYLKVANTETGNVKIVKGPRLFFPGPYDECSKVLGASSSLLALLSRQYELTLQLQLPSPTTSMCSCKILRWVPSL